MELTLTFASLFKKTQPTSGVTQAKPYAVLEDIGIKTGAFIQPPKSYSDRVSRTEISRSDVQVWIDELTRLC